METPHGASDGGGTHERAHPASVEQGTAFDLPRLAAQEKPVALLDSSAHRCIPHSKTEPRPESARRRGY